MKHILLWAVNQGPIKLKLYLALLSSCLFFFIVPPLFPSWKVFHFVPWLALVITYSTFLRSLWSAFVTGLLLDLLSATTFGMHTLNFSIVTAYLFTKRRYFIKENPYNLSLFTTIYSFTLTLLYTLLFFIFDRRWLVSGKWIVTDLLLFSLFDGMYAYFGFTLPFSLWESLEKKWKIKYGIK